MMSKDSIVIFYYFLKNSVLQDSPTKSNQLHTHSWRLYIYLIYIRTHLDSEKSVRF